LGFLAHAAGLHAPGVPTNTPLTRGERFATRTAQPRMLMSILIAFDGLAALVAALGVCVLTTLTTHQAVFSAL
jgi:hypothetical protein